MTVEEIQQAIVEVVTEVQSLSGRQQLQITPGTCPMRDLQGFDSLNAVEVATALSERIGCNLSQDVALFQRGGHAASINEIAQGVHHLVKASGGK